MDVVRNEVNAMGGRIETATAQIATVAMAAHYAAPLLVVAGTTLGMLIADVPAVFVGDKLASRIPMKLVHGIAAAMFAALAVATLLGAGRAMGF